MGERQTRGDFRSLLKQEKIIFFDGAMGTNLERMGIPPGTPPEMLNFTDPEKVQKIHLSYREVGADVIETNTFGANRIKLARYGLAKEAKALSREGVCIAREVAGPCLVGASVGPLGAFLAPWGKISAQEALDVFREQIEAVSEAGADLIVIETMDYVKEAKIAIQAVREVGNLPIVCQFTFQKEGRTLMGTDAAGLVTTISSLEIDVLGANCSSGPEELLAVVEEMMRVCPLPLIVQPNAGQPILKNGQTCFSLSPQAFALWMEKIAQKGVKIVGGCCGTTSEHLKVLVDRLKHFSPPKRSILSASRLSSRRRVVQISHNEFSFTIGGKIDATESRVREALVSQDWDYFRKLVDEQLLWGISALLIRVKGVGSSLGEEEIGKLINLVQEETDAPLILDIRNPSLLEEALGEMEGKCLIFCPGENEKIFSLIRKYGVSLAFTLGEEKMSALNTGLFLRAKHLVEKTGKNNILGEEIFLHLVISSAFSLLDNKLPWFFKQIKQELGAGIILELNNLVKTSGSSLSEDGFLNEVSRLGVDGIILREFTKDLLAIRREK